MWERLARACHLWLQAPGSPEQGQPHPIQSRSTYTHIVLFVARCLWFAYVLEARLWRTYEYRVSSYRVSSLWRTYGFCISSYEYRGASLDVCVVVL